MNEQETTITPQLLRERFPELGGIDESQAAFFIEEATGMISERRFGKRTTFARLLCAAHLITLLSPADTGAGAGSYKTPTGSGVIASKSVGSASVSYDTSFGVDQDAGWWNKTKYGQSLWELMKRFRRMPFVVSGRAVVPSWPR